MGRAGCNWEMRVLISTSQSDAPLTILRTTSPVVLTAEDWERLPSPPPPEGFVSPMLWGVESHVIERFGKAGIPAERISFERDTFTFRSPHPPAHFLGLFRDYYGPTMNAYEAARNAGKEADLHRELEALFTAHNQGAAGTTSIPATFLRVTVRV